MKDFKIRAYDKDKKLMLDIMDRSWHEAYNMKIGDFIPTTILRIGMLYDSTMLFTGLKDKKGKDIYEDDILLWDKINCGKIEVVCKWDYYSLNQYDLYNDQLEVIGNIHQHSELLRK